jgi:hypothetical protein
MWGTKIDKNRRMQVQSRNHTHARQSDPLFMNISAKIVVAMLSF